MNNREIPDAILSAAISLLQPYCPDLTEGKLREAILFKPEPKPPEKLLNRKEAAVALNVSIPTIDRMLTCPSF